MCIHVTKPQHIPQTSTLACISSTLKRSHTQATLHCLSLSSPHLTTWYETVKQFIHSFTNPSTHHRSRQHWSAGKKQHWLFHLAPTQWNWNLYVIILRKLFTFHSNSGGGSSSMCLGRWMDGGERHCLHRKAKRNKKKKNNWANGNNYKRETNWK